MGTGNFIFQVKKKTKAEAKAKAEAEAKSTICWSKHQQRLIGTVQAHAHFSHTHISHISRSHVLTLSQPKADAM